MKKGFILPSNILSEYIDRYWYWETESGEQVSLPEIYPATGTEFIFHYNYPFKGFPKSHILCPRGKGQYNLKQNGSTGFISVRFKSWAFQYFSKTPTDIVIDKIIDAESLWSKKGKQLEEQIYSSSNLQERVNYLNIFFENQLINDLNQNLEIDWTINHIYYNYNKNLKIADIISDTNLSTRTFQRRFKCSTGINAKCFMKISRFQTLLKKSLISKTYPTIDILLSNGYYDQSHFNKDFNELTGCNPTTIISKSNYLTHFYNTSFN